MLYAGDMNLLVSNNPPVMVMKKELARLEELFQANKVTVTGTVEGERLGGVVRLHLQTARFQVVVDPYFKGRLDMLNIFEIVNLQLNRISL